MRATQEQARGGLLHNMSAPPKSVVQYGGLMALKTELPGHDRPGRQMKVSGAVALRFELPADLKARNASGLLRHLGVTAGREPSVQLDALIETRARELPLPPGCAVLASQPSHRVIWQDTLSVLAVLAKCSDTLWLRDKNPSLMSALARSRVSLLVPARFVSHLPKDPS